LNLSSRHAEKIFLTPEEKRKVEEDEHLKNIERMLAEANAKSAEIINNANKQAEETIRKVAVEAAGHAEALKQQASQQGYSEGFVKGQQEGAMQAKQEIKESVWGIDVLTSAAFDVKKEIINSAEKEVVELSIAIAENILRQKLELEPDLIKGIIRTAINQLPEKEEIKIIVNPALAENLYEFVDGLKNEIRGLKSVKIAEDKTIPRDGVIVESPETRIDGRLTTRLSEITKNLMREYSEKANSGVVSEEINVVIDETARKLMDLN
jgi:flagellar assembly protein FliH